MDNNPSLATLIQQYNDSFQSIVNPHDNIINTTAPPALWRWGINSYIIPEKYSAVVKPSVYDIQLPHNIVSSPGLLQPENFDFRQIGSTIYLSPFKYYDGTAIYPVLNNHSIVYTDWGTNTAVLPISPAIHLGFNIIMWEYIQNDNIIYSNKYLEIQQYDSEDFSTQNDIFYHLRVNDNNYIVELNKHISTVTINTAHEAIQVSYDQNTGTAIYATQYFPVYGNIDIISAPAYNDIRYIHHLGLIILYGVSEFNALNISYTAVPGIYYTPYDSLYQELSYTLDNTDNQTNNFLVATKILSINN